MLLKKITFLNFFVVYLGLRLVDGDFASASAETFTTVLQVQGTPAPPVAASDTQGAASTDATRLSVLLHETKGGASLRSDLVGTGFYDHGYTPLVTPGKQALLLSGTNEVPEPVVATSAEAKGAVAADKRVPLRMYSRPSSRLKQEAHGGFKKRVFAQTSRLTGTSSEDEDFDDEDLDDDADFDDDDELSDEETEDSIDLLKLVRDPPSPVPYKKYDDDTPPDGVDSEGEWESDYDFPDVNDDDAWEEWEEEHTPTEEKSSPVGVIVGTTGFLGVMAGGAAYYFVRRKMKRVHTVEGKFLGDP